MFELKRIHQQAIPAAIERAERYRLLNEPIQAESICLDILAVEPDNQRALVTLLLALTDQFEARMAAAAKQATDALTRLTDAYHRRYYEGIVHERQAKAHIKRHNPGSAYIAHDLLRKAMTCYEAAAELRASTPGGLDNDEAILRWNACARILMRHPELKPEPRPAAEPMLE
jgi:hypothetical protein